MGVVFLANTILPKIRSPFHIFKKRYFRNSGLSKIGQPFFTTKEKGTGLGLMVCQKIIQNHDGKLTIASKENEGTTLHIVLSR